MLGEDLRDTIDRADDRSRFDILLVDFIDTIYLWYTGLVEAKILHGMLEVDLFGLGRQRVFHGAVKQEKFAALDSQFLSCAFVRQELIVCVVE